ncbi:MAG: aminotransferase class V-fold PLP-dependent enzyme [Rhodospirillales bacterium]|nr:aminotransferase class V-fold PLP-dependent enzyme [Rhodospirillales bacterium]
MSEFGAACRGEFLLDPAVTFLNHGSFGATPHAVMDAAEGWRRRMEADTTGFIRRIWPSAVAAARHAAAAFLKTDPEGLALVDNATQGANAVLQSLDFAPGDEIAVTTHGYRAVAKTVELVCRRTGAVPRVVALPFDGLTDDLVVAMVGAAIGPRTKLVVVDHITSPTALVLPVARLVAEAKKHGVPILVDGAHAPGQIDLDLDALDADFYVGNAHKWMFAGKGAAILSVAKRWRARIHPTSISHGLGKGLHAEFDWTGTRDVGSWLSIPDGIAFGERYGWGRIRAHNDALCARAAVRIAGAYGTEICGPAGMRAHLAAIRLPVEGPADEARAIALYGALYDRTRIQAPVMAFGDRLWVRISAQIYNDMAQYERLAAVDWRAY